MLRAFVDLPQCHAITQIQLKSTWVTMPLHTPPCSDCAATVSCCGCQDMQQRIGVDLSHIIQPGDAAVPGGEDEYDPEQGGAF